MSEISMWLYPVTLAAVIGLVLNFRFGVHWTWGICVQQAFILIAGLLGCFFLYAPLPPPYAVLHDQFATACTIVAWIMFVIFNLGQRLLLSRLTLDLSLFRIKRAMRKAQLVPFLIWGPPGQYWKDITQAMVYYHEGNSTAANAIIDKWRQDRRLPPAARDSLIGFHMLGRVLVADWNSLIYDFETNQPKLGSFIPYQLATRAYAEVGRYAEAEQCIRKANAQPAKTSATNLDINFMTLFALFGAIKQLDDVLQRCRDFRALPHYVRNYWRGRCYAVRGDAHEAVAHLQRSKRETPQEVEAWHQRIEKTLTLETAKVAGQMPVADAAAEPALAARAYELYRDLRTVPEVLSPPQTSRSVIIIATLLVVAYGISTLDTSYVQLGQLSLKTLEHGDYYRTISYQFLHGNTAHLLLNCFALILFGRSVANVYGAPKFLLIFFTTGILSGIFQVILIPNDFVIGASGAILGVFGAAIAGLIKLKGILPDSIRKQELRWMGSIAVAQVVFDQVANGIAALTDKSPDGVRIGAFAHLGGMIFGFIIGMILPLKKINRVDR